MGLDVILGKIEFIKTSSFAKSTLNCLTNPLSALLDIVYSIPENLLYVRVAKELRITTLPFALTNLL